LAWGVACALTPLSCGRETHARIELAVGKQEFSFTPRSAVAEYVEVPDARQELKVTLASGEAACDRFVALQAGETAVSVVLVTPPGSKPAAGVFPAAPGASDTKGSITSAYVVPKAFVGQESRVLGPGGGMRLTQVQLVPGGVVEGVLAFENAGSATAPATRLNGAFRARFCRVDGLTSGSSEGSARTDRSAPDKSARPAR
jgi:hypothetical protein